MILRRKDGVVLITTLWILLILSVLALGFTIDLQLEARMARTQMDTHQAYYLARAGVIRALVELKNDAILDHRTRNAIYDAPGDCWANNEETDKIYKDIELGEGTYTVKVQDELGKININKASLKMFEGLFQALDFKEDDAKFYATAIIDYRDGDDYYNQDSSYTEEEFYYGSKDTTHVKEHFKNAPFVSPIELLNVPGFKPEILYEPRAIYNNPDNKVALIDLLTVEGDGMTNVNTAPLPVLTAMILGMVDEDVGNAISIAENLEDRILGVDRMPGTDDDKPFTNAGEVATELGPINPLLGARLSRTVRTDSNMFKIISVGKIGKAQTTVEALVKREWVVTILTPEELEMMENQFKGAREGVRVQILKWQEY
jgi:type II secretory pathway component PulK